MTGLEVSTRRGWRALRPDATPTRVLETERIVIRGGTPGADARIGWTVVPFDQQGNLSLSPNQDEHLHGHVGLVEVSDTAGRLLGEIDLVPDKMSAKAYEVLRADLQRVWGDLVLADQSPASISAGPPPASVLWSRIAEPVRSILDNPNEHLVVATGVRRMDRARHRRDLQPAVVRAGLRNRAALARTMERSVETPENHLVAATIRLLRSHARRDPEAGALVRTLDAMLRHRVLAGPTGPLRRITWGMRSDARYRQVLGVHQILNRPELAPTEGPGELRLGVPALTRLYEYWVFLQVLLAARERYGQPVGAGFTTLATELPHGRHRFELRAGTTVSFPGPVHVAFEPRIDTAGTGWGHLEYVPHPDPTQRQRLATPDVVVYAPDRRAMLVIDAKYVGRAFVERDAARIHAKYARIRDRGVPVVRHVIAAHPHADLSSRWAGYGHLPFCPGHPVPGLPLPTAARAPTTAQTPTVAESPGPSHDPVTAAGQPAADDANGAGWPTGGIPHRAPREPGSVVVIADTFWMHRWLDGRRLDLRALRTILASDRPIDTAMMVVPPLTALASFAHAAQGLGWTIVRTLGSTRDEQIDRLADEARSRATEGPVIVFTADLPLIERLTGMPPVEIVSKLDRPPFTPHDRR